MRRGPHLAEGAAEIVMLGIVRTTVQVARLLSAARRHELARHHLARSMFRFAKVQLLSRLSSPLLVPYVNTTRIHAAAGLTGANGNHYFGLHECADMAFTLHYLRAGDLFVDVGANVGSYTLLASGAAGATSVAFEPVPQTVAHLRANILANALSRTVEVREICLGSHNGVVLFTNDADTVNHVARQGEAGIEVPMRRLDEEVEGPIALLKVDAEGSDGDVLAGAQRLLASTQPMALIVESLEASVLDQLLGLGFQPCRYDFRRRLIQAVARSQVDGNSLLVRDVSSAQARVAIAPRFDLHGFGLI